MYFVIRMTICTLIDITFLLIFNHFTPRKTIMPLRHQGLLWVKDNEKILGEGAMNPILNHNQEKNLNSSSKECETADRWTYLLLSVGISVDINRKHYFQSISCTYILFILFWASYSLYSVRYVSIHFEFTWWVW